MDKQQEHDPFRPIQWCEAHEGPAEDVNPVYIGDPLKGERRMVCQSCLRALQVDMRVAPCKGSVPYRTTQAFPSLEHGVVDDGSGAALRQPYVVEPRHTSDIQVLRLLGFLVQEAPHV